MNKLGIYFIDNKDVLDITNDKEDWGIWIFICNLAATNPCCCIIYLYNHAINNGLNMSFILTKNYSYLIWLLLSIAIVSV